MNRYDPENTTGDAADNDANADLSPPQQHELEAMLGGLTLRAPSAALDARIEQTLSAPGLASASAPASPTQPTTPPTAPLVRIGWPKGLSIAAAIGVAAAVGIALWTGGPTTPPHQAVTRQAPENAGPSADPSTDIAQASRAVPASYSFDPKPVDLTWSRDLERGTLTTDSGQQYRTYLREAVDQRVYTDPVNQATMQVNTPRHEWIVEYQPTF